MRWFFALNQASSAFSEYADLVKVSVHTAQKHTSLIPHCLYDGAECDLTDWLRGRGVTIIPCRSQFYPALERLAQIKSDPYYLTGGAGAFLRLEIPRIAAEQGFSNADVLYTDCDVMFLREVVPDLSVLTPRFFSVAPEANFTDYRAMNTGVMLMHLSGLSKEDQRFLEFAHWYLDTLTDHEAGFTWDQSTYRFYYSPLTRLLLRSRVSDKWRGRIAYRLRWLDPPRWDRLPQALNWKPYWGDPASAGIVHFHGPKPTNPRFYTDEHPAPIVRGFTGGSYPALCVA